MFRGFLYVKSINPSVAKGSKVRRIGWKHFSSTSNGGGGGETWSKNLMDFLGYSLKESPSSSSWIRFSLKSICKI
jgi:hypothetical protein